MRTNLGILSLIVVAALLAGACGGPAALTGAVVGKLGAGGPTDDLLKNGAYEIPYVGPIQLSNGAFEKRYGDGASMVASVGYMQAAFGDLNNDGVEDAVVIIWGNAGGPDTSVYMVAVTSQGKVLRQAAHALLGNGVKMTSLTINGGKIVAKTLGLAAGDPQCCPTVEATQTFTLNANTLKEVALK
jgi:hypothetical protein